MKRIISSLLFCIAFAIQMYGQNEYVIADSYAPDGSRHTISYGSSFFKLCTYTMAIESVIKNNQQTWFLLMQSDDIPKNALVLLKLFNNDTIELSLSELNTKEYYTSSSLMATSFFGNITTNTTKEHEYLARFSITPNQLDTIATYGVAKIRISTTADYEEAKWKRDKLGTFIKNEIANINEHLKIYDKPIIYENF